MKIPIIIRPNKRANNCDCFFSYMYEKNLHPNHYICWVEVRRLLNGSYVHNQDYSKMVKAEEIYIYNFDYKKTLNYQHLLLDTINTITPCRFDTINDVKYIYFKMLETYDQSLILLNFIRNLWYDPLPAESYRITFFETLKKIHDNFPNADPLEKLTRSNIIAYKNKKILYSLNHSNVHPNPQPRIKQQLLDYKENSTKIFLTSLDRKQDWTNSNLTISDDELKIFLEHNDANI